MRDVTDAVGGSLTAAWAKDAFNGDSLRGTMIPVGGKRRRLEAARALLAYLDREPGDSGLERFQIQGNPDIKVATLYKNVGLHGENPLVKALPAELHAVRGKQNVKRLLAAETKVWSFVPMRRGWLMALADGDRRFAAETLVRVLARWAAGEPGLAAVDGCEPPLTAVEDLWRISAGAPAASVLELLTKVVGTVVADPGRTAPSVLDSFHSDLMGVLGITDFTWLDQEVTRFLDAARDLDFLLQRAGEPERKYAASRLSGQLANLLRSLEEGDG